MAWRRSSDSASIAAFTVAAISLLANKASGVSPSLSSFSVREVSSSSSRDARADSIPGLEIEADDVRCTHGSTSGRVDEQQVFYAMTRGYTRREAVRMIVAGFFQQVFDRITIESVREALGEAIGRRVSDIKDLAGA